MNRFFHLNKFMVSLLVITMYMFLPISTLFAGEQGIHKVLLQISSNNAETMNLVLNNASNINKYYQEKGEEVQIEIVAFGPGLNMLREDKSPVTKRIRSIAQNFESVSFKACNNTLQKALIKEKKKTIPLLPEAKIVDSGVIHLIQRQEEGWKYVKP